MRISGCLYGCIKLICCHGTASCFVKCNQVDWRSCVMTSSRWIPCKFGLSPLIFLPDDDGDFRQFLHNLPMTAMGDLGRILFSAGLPVQNTPSIRWTERWWASLTDFSFAIVPAYFSSFRANSIVLYFPSLRSVQTVLYCIFTWIIALV